jgi:glycosyltransferase involved in cell wall biosynthesis
MKTSLISTVLDEEKTIDFFLKSILRQTKKPDEIIIVDAGSTDKTIKKIKEWQKKLPIKLIIKPGANRSQGRNIAIRNAKYQNIAISDAGCILASNWLKEITKPLENKETFVVAGNYQPIAKTPFQECLVAYTCADIRQKDKRQFLPSSRSIAFKKKVWKKVGGYPKKLNYCEDLVFDQKIKRAGFSFRFSPKAVVYWPQRKTPQGAFKQFYNYAFGDGQVFFSPYQTHSIKILLIFLRYLAGLIIVLLAIRNPAWRSVAISLILTYLLWPIAKTRKILSKQALIITPIIQILTDIAVMTGAANGILKSIKKKIVL